MERRDFVIAALIWLAVSVGAVGVIYFLMDPFPTKGSEEADLIDEAFAAMSYMAAPVFGFVIAVLVYSVLRFRGHGAPTEDGPPIHGTNWVPKAWFAVTAVLAVTVMIFPGLTGLADLRDDNTAEMEVDILAFQWSWIATYPDAGVSVSPPGGELVLPANTRIRFAIESSDVVHSFWIPALGPKMDAVPGVETELFVTTKEPGSPETDHAGYRLQCAELCGLRHSEMMMPVRVVEQDKFEAWLATAAQPTVGPVEGEELAVALKEWSVTPERTSADGGAIRFAVSNEGAIPHEFVVIRTAIPAGALPTEGGVVDESSPDLEVLGRTSQLLAGSSTDLGAELTPGRYALICNLPGHYQAGMWAGFTVR